MTAAQLLLPALLFRSCLCAEDEKLRPPFFTPDSIVNSASGIPASLTPNGLATVFGTDLAAGTASVAGAAVLPTELGDVRIRIGGLFAYLLYVSPTQINFLIPGELIPGATDLLVNKQSLGLSVRIKLLDSAPALFASEGQVAATHADGSLISPDSPARPGEIIVVYGAGLGRTDPSQIDGLIPRSAAGILLLDRLRVMLEGQPIPSENILYAGITPGSAGLYQINLRLPDQVTSENPELRIALGEQTSQRSLVIRVAAGAP